ncbi:hypothetical protein CXQ80_10970 [Pseudomonas sp. 02C 26]|nr:hypothetical protein CXQ80_10970 [Pseudomonas sp. 02C 26]
MHFSIYLKPFSFAFQLAGSTAVILENIHGEINRIMKIVFSTTKHAPMLLTKRFEYQTPTFQINGEADVSDRLLHASKTII